MLVIYVLDHPEYVEALARHPRELGKDGPKRKNIQALISYAKEHVPGMKAVYAELSEVTHFGSKAMWAFATPVESSGGGRRHHLRERYAVAQRRAGPDRLRADDRDRRRGDALPSAVRRALGAPSASGMKRYSAPRL